MGYYNPEERAAWTAKWEALRAEVLAKCSDEDFAATGITRENIAAMKESDVYHAALCMEAQRGKTFENRKTKRPIQLEIDKCES